MAAVSGQPAQGIIHVSRRLLCPTTSPSLPFVDRARQTHIYSSSPSSILLSFLPSSRAFFRGFFRGRIDTNCKTLSATVLPNDSSRRRRFFLAPVVVAVHSWKRTLPSRPRFRVMFVCSFPFPLRPPRRCCGNFLRRGEKLFLLVFCTRDDTRCRDR